MPRVGSKRQTPEPCAWAASSLVPPPPALPTHPPRRVFLRSTPGLPRLPGAPRYKARALCNVSPRVPSAASPPLSNPPLTSREPHMVLIWTGARGFLLCGPLLLAPSLPRMTSCFRWPQMAPTQCPCPSSAITVSSPGRGEGPAVRPQPPSWATALASPTHLGSGRPAPGWTAVPGATSDDRRVSAE